MINYELEYKKFKALYMNLKTQNMKGGIQPPINVEHNVIATTLYNN